MAKFAAIMFIAGVAISSPVWALGATVETVSPQLSINRGQGYEKLATASAHVSAGDQVMADPGGRGKIIYSDGCVVDVNPGAVVTVGKCYTPMRAGLEVPPPAAVGIPWWLVGGTAAFIGVGICAAQGCFKDDDNQPPRPRSP